MLISLFLSGALAYSAPLSLFGAGDHCVAYQASKTLFLLAQTKVVGKTCNVSSQVTPALDGKYLIEVRMPSNSFESGEKKRDEDVAKLLGPSGVGDVMFRTDERTAVEWHNLIMQEKFEIPGVVVIDGKEHAVTAEATHTSTPEGYEIDGVIKTNLKHLGITPPTMVGGVFAKVQNDIELHFHLKGDRTLGAASILSAVPAVAEAAAEVAPAPQTTKTSVKAAAKAAEKSVKK